MEDKDSQDIAWLIVAAIGLVGVWRTWTLHVRPWASEQWSELQGAAEAGEFDGLLVDVVGVAVLALPVLLILLLLRGSVRRARRRRRAGSDELDQARGKKLSGKR